MCSDKGQLRWWTLGCVLALIAVISGCGDDSDDRAGLQPVPTRTTAAAVISDPSSAADTIDVSDFTVLPTFTCLKDTPARSLVTVGWSAPTATDVVLSLDGQVLPVGIRDQVPYQVPAGGSTGIGATVVFACDGLAQHTIDVAWTALGSPLASRTVTITKEPIDG